MTIFLSPCDAQADQNDALSAITEFDKAMLSIFRQGQDALTAQTRPVMVIARDVTVMTKTGDASYPRDAPSYLIFKSTSHVLLGIIGAVTPWPEDAAENARWKEDFEAISTAIDTLLASVDHLNLPEDAIARQRQMLDTARSFIRDAISRGTLTPEEVSKAINDMRPVWAANMRDAARAELAALHKAVSDARAAMSKDDWDKMYVVHHGGSNVTGVNVVELYLERVMPQKVVAGQVMFAENAHGNKAMADYVGYELMQRHVGVWAFGDPRRMEVDLLGYEAGSVLDEMIRSSPPLE
ncbi:hypothetical protein RA27_03730 [Ruegeria sp. ANG-R]|uniref:hypothetical protein n=1 Tax=Ruegeria sp. ANG-R TaxID=1577903 RepID=UPI00057FE446|nr:hypothetical protein [Ruegeria sp. ANG-R]KIC42485.1 hypothetical protein RA27_03730 [Ruegeria sp. ANG-R]